MNSFKKVALAAACVLAVSFFTPSAKADKVNWETLATFNQPVEVPGMVLAAGTYMFMVLPDTNDLPDHVLIYDSTGTHLYAVVNAVPQYRVHVSPKPKFTFEERAKGAPEALKTWFWPSYHYGVEFVYNHTHAS